MIQETSIHACWRCIKDSYMAYILPITWRFSLTIRWSWIFSYLALTRLAPFEAGASKGRAFPSSHTMQDLVLMLSLNFSSIPTGIGYRYYSTHSSLSVHTCIYAYQLIGYSASSASASKYQRKAAYRSRSLAYFLQSAKGSVVSA